MQPEVNPTHVIIDDREANSKVAKVLTKMKGIVVDIQRLSIGDYQIDGGLIVERKTLPDLANSIKSGRVFRQACRLASSPIRSAMILEGTTDDLQQSHLRREAIQGALITITLVLGIPLLRSKDPQESARLLMYAGRQITRIPTRAYPRPGKRPRGKVKVQLHILQGLPGVGPERAAHLLEAFGSVEAVISAPIGELASVSGIGNKTAPAIRWSVSQ